MSPTLNDLTGRRFGRLLVICRDTNNKPGKVKFVCRCDCGNTKSVSSSLMTRGKAISCGCYRKERLTTHGASRRGRVRPEFKTWCGMKDRCLNHNSRLYAYYGGRGITIHPTWVKDFSAFLSSVGERPSPSHSLDRIDNDGNYEPGNVKWSTAKEQIHNRRIVNNMQNEINQLKATIAQLNAELTKTNCELS